MRNVVTENTIELSWYRDWYHPMPGNNSVGITNFSPIPPFFNAVDELRLLDQWKETVFHRLGHWHVS